MTETTKAMICGIEFPGDGTAVFRFTDGTEAVFPARDASFHSAQAYPVKPPRLVILESPYAGSIDANLAYGRACLRDSLARGEAPIASHLLYTQPGVLDDTVPAERQRGIIAGLAWIRVADATVVYTDHGISSGMQQGMDTARAAGLPVEIRSLHEPQS